MGSVRHLSVSVIAVLIIGACTWGTYDGHSPAGTGLGVLIDPSVGGVAVSSDGLFEIQIPPNGINVQARVSITQSPGPGGLALAVQYGVSLVAASGGPSAQLWQHPSVLVFHLGASGIKVPPPDVFIINNRPSNGGTLPGGTIGEGSDIFAIQAADTSASNLGPYAMIHVGAQPSSNACGNSDVCSPCFRNCVGGNSANTAAPGPGSGIPIACYCHQLPSPDCMRTCVDNGSGKPCT